MSVLLEPFVAEAVPLAADSGGGYLMRNTRIPFDTVIYAYLDGASPEQIVSSYDTLALADVYAAVAYYWRNKDRVHEYLAARQKASVEKQHEDAARFPGNGAWERLQAVKVKT